MNVNNVQPLRMLPRFDSHVFRQLSESVSESQMSRILLPRFHSDHQRHFYDGNQSAEATISQTNLPGIDPHSNKFDIKFLERAYARSGKKCWPIVNTNITNLDLEYAYEIIGDTLESYVRYRKLSQCKALANFIDYRNKVYKREKLAQYALPTTETHVKDTPTKKLASPIPKIIHIEEKQSSSPSTISQGMPSPSVLSVKSSNPSSKITNESLIQIPSPDLLKKSTPKKIVSPTPSKQNNLIVPKKFINNVKRLPPPVKGQS
ncbi:unnamed protein product [Adineta ricciae]|uniref:Uncharacterized protein n=1 Tax=Adineta ricciae TaxID=249248 RepID=A0A816AKB7_ADIRI|nr:unnamed protein product [Adineta ricciae]CAF1596701.1 unnamed protein product [Adineta ricciae]